MKNEKNSSITGTTVFLIFCFSLLFTFQNRDGAHAADMQGTYKNLEVFSNVLSMIEQNYVEEIDTQAIIDGAIKGMLTTLDPHSSYLKPEDFKELQVETKGSFSGIGIEITMKDGILTVVSPIEDTPAFKQGLQAGDMIIKIEGESTKDMSLMDAVKKLRGVKGTEVTISIHREGWSELQNFTIVRDVIPLHSVRSTMLEPGYGYIRITNFQNKTTADLKDALDKLSAKGELKGLILDLRNNPGGLLDQSIKVSDLFLEEGIIVSTKGRLTGQDMEKRAHAHGQVYKQPLIILVNQGSASASEIVAGALQDHKRAVILGTQTFGKGSVQTIIPMANGAGLRLTTARYYTPNGSSIQAKGIIPDIIVPVKKATDETADQQKEQPSFVREKDLKHHLENGDKLIDNGESDKADEGKNNGTADAKTRELLTKDNQLNAALLILKSLNIFSEFSSVQ